MLIAIAGDVHGRVFHLLAALVTWQHRSGRRLDAIVQVGDMGAFPGADAMDEATRTYLALDSAEGDLARLVYADGRLQEHLSDLRAEFSTPVYFTHGNHDDLSWLTSRFRDSSCWVDVDPFGFLRYVRDGSVLSLAGMRVAFLGGEDRPGAVRDLDHAAYARLMDLGHGACDILISHDGPHGIATGRNGQTQGSERISALAAHLQPAFHVTGHYHHLVGPRSDGATTTLALSSLVASARWNPDALGLQPGCIAILDTDIGALTPLTEPWLAAFPTPFEFDS